MGDEAAIQDLSSMTPTAPPIS